ncbi:MAG: MerR family transcriptional regulator [Candidatus Heritagella sp.]
MTIQQVSQKYGLTEDTLRYYERVGMIPPVPRTGGGRREYGESDCQWVELAKCMRAAGLPVQKIVEYAQLCREGDHTFPQRLALLKDQREQLLDTRRQLDETLKKLEYKIGRYEEAVQTGALSWD